MAETQYRQGKFSTLQHCLITCRYFHYKNKTVSLSAYIFINQIISNKNFLYIEPMPIYLIPGRILTTPVDTMTKHRNHFNVQTLDVWKFMKISFVSITRKILQTLESPHLCLDRLVLRSFLKLVGIIQTSHLVVLRFVIRRLNQILSWPPVRFTKCQSWHAPCHGSLAPLPAGWLARRPYLPCYRTPRALGDSTVCNESLQPASESGLWHRLSLPDLLKKRPKIYVWCDDYQWAYIYYTKPIWIILLWKE